MQMFVAWDLINSENNYTIAPNWTLLPQDCLSGSQDIAKIVSLHLTSSCEVACIPKTGIVFHAGIWGNYMKEGAIAQFSFDGSGIGGFIMHFSYL